MTDASILVGYKRTDPAGSDLPPMSPLDMRRARWWLWLLTLLVFGTVVFLQQAGGKEPVTLAERQALAVGDTVEPPRTSMLVLMGKLMFGLEQLSPGQGGQILQMIEQQVGLEPGGAVPAPPSAGEQGEGAAPGEPGPPAAERFRVAVLAAEVQGPEAAEKQLEALRDDLSDESPLREDIETALTVYDRGPDAVDPARAGGLTDRHGWFGKLLLSHGRGDADPFRAAAMAQGMTTLVFFMAFGGGVLVAGFTGLVLLMIGAVLAATGRLRSATARSVVARPGSGVWLETFAIFLIGFLSLKLIAAYAAGHAAPGAVWPIWLQLGGQWSLVVLVLWPLVRGMSFAQYRGEVGWHRGRGFAREVGSGLAAYLAALPVYVAVALVVVMLSLLYRHLLGIKDEPPVPDNRVFEIFERGSVAMSALLASLVVMWAPLVEETMFRGALFRAVRPAAGALGAALITAAMFAMMHPYGPMQMVLVGTLGFVFAMMREWRGGLLPSMTAHAVHNSVVMTLVLVVMQLARG